MHTTEQTDLIKDKLAELRDGYNIPAYSVLLKLLDVRDSYKKNNPGKDPYAEGIEYIVSELNSFAKEYIKPKLQSEQQDSL